MQGSYMMRKYSYPTLTDQRKTKKHVSIADEKKPENHSEMYPAIASH